jgi:hypothetical protein
MSKCKGCGKEIEWFKTPAGRLNPYEKMQVFKPVLDLPAGEPLNINKHPGYKAEKVEGEYYVSHFLTCPKANMFSGSNTRKPEQGSFL